MKVCFRNSMKIEYGSIGIDHSLFYKTEGTPIQPYFAKRDEAARVGAKLRIRL